MMTITMDVLLERLEQTFAVSSFGQLEHAGFYHASFCRSMIQPREQCLYLGTRVDYLALRKKYTNQPFLCLEELEKEDLQEGTAVIYGSLRGKETEVYDTILDLLEEYRRWEAALDRCSYDLPGIRKMLNVSRTFLGGILLFSDHNFNQIAYTREYELFGYVDPANPARLPDRAIQRLLDDPDYYKISFTREPFLYENEENHHSTVMLCYNLFRKEETSFSGRLILLTETGRFSRNQHRMIRLLGDRINKIYANLSDFSLPLSAYTALRGAIRDLVSGEAPARARLSMILKEVRWSMTDTYLMIFLSPELRTQEQPLHQMICSHLEFLYQDACALMWENAVVLLVNMTRCGLKTAEEAQQRLPVVLRDNLLKAGLSREFQDMSMAHTAFLEAQAAVQIGNNKHSAYWYYYFNDYVVDYLLMGNPLELPQRLLMHPAFSILDEYDKQHGTALYATLKCYISCQYNMTHTAEQLYMHRSTLQRHIDKIIVLTGLVFQNEETRFHLLYSYLLAKRENL